MTQQELSIHFKRTEHTCMQTKEALALLAGTHRDTDIILLDRMMPEMGAVICSRL